MLNVLFALSVALPAVTAAKPNVLIIYADDMGWGDVGYHGVKDILTPNIDKLAAEGVSFSQGYVCASVCGPSRCGLMTGLYQQRLGCGENPSTQGFPEAPRFPFAGLPTSQPILSEMLRPLGYRCGMVGKWHLGLHETMRPNARGFDYYYGFLNGAHSYEKALPKFGPKKELWPLFRNNRMEPPYEGYLTDTFTHEAVAFIERGHGKPFFLYVAYNAVHAPWQVPDKYRERTKHLSDIEDRRFFAAMVLAMDDGVGRIMQALDKAGVSDDTLVFFISDNGTPRGQGLGYPRKDHTKERGGCSMSSAGPFRGFKGDTFEGGIRVPFIMRWPGRIKPGTTYDQPVINLDVVPTVMARLGVEHPPCGFDFDGVDLLPYLRGEHDGTRPHDVLYWRRDDDYAIRRGDWKLAWNDHSVQPGSGAMLFNLKDDPGEHHDLSAEHPELKQALQSRFDAWDGPLPPSRCWGPPGNRGGRTRAVDVAIGDPGADGVVLAAGDAVLHGTTLRRGRDVVSHWREPDEWLEWEFVPRRGGRHEVLLEYAAPHATSLRVEVDGDLSETRVPRRADWGDRGAGLVGSVVLKRAQRCRLALKPGAAWRAINVHRVVVRPGRGRPPLKGTAGGGAGVHLFILSGQSNMAGLDPDESFTPTVESAFGADRVIVVKDALGGQPIRRWYKQWHAAGKDGPEATGDLYDRLMGHVRETTHGRLVESVTFVWMQGERDAKEGHGDVYAAGLRGLLEQLSDDLGRHDVNLVVGRLSDFDMANARYPHWTRVRQAQVDVAESYARGTWVDTDDLNDGENRRGRTVTNDLHYAAAGYRELGSRFARSAIRLIKGERDKRPNIILIMADDLGVECLGSYGCTEYKTPELDRLAREGIRFTHCYAQPLCTPSRVQIMTGRYNNRNYDGFGVLRRSEITFGNMLRDAGYRTCVAGKWQLAGDKDSPGHFGFDEYCLWFLYPPAKEKGGQAQGRRYWEPYRFWQNGKMKTVAKDAYGPDLFCSYIEGFIARNRAQPFFAYYPMALTHAPFEPAPDTRHATRSDRDFSQHKYKDDTYMKDMVAYMDKIVGRIRKALAKHGAADNTIILFTGDNGTDKRVTTETENGAVRGGKGDMTDGGTHVPLVALYPAKTPAGTVSDALIDFSDFMPTFAEAAGVTLPTDRVIDGVSFLPLLCGEKGNPREWVFCHYWGFGRRKADASSFARTQRYKVYDDGRFYDIQTDPKEQTPLKHRDFGDEARQVKAKLKQVIVETMK